MNTKFQKSKIKKLIIDELLLVPRTIGKKIEPFPDKHQVELNHAPIFIVSNARSGSTLLYQVITRHFNVCYFSNFICSLHESPICAAMIARLFNGCNPPNLFSNRYGKTTGWNSPNQGENIWKRWFNDLYDYKYVNIPITKEQIRSARNTIFMIQKFFNAPFVAKWQPLSLRISEIVSILPSALFIYLKRKPEFIAQSILCSRRDLWGDEKRWFSTKPRNYEAIKDKSALEQIYAQITNIEKNIENDINMIGINRCLAVTYEELCKSPKRVMTMIKSLYEINQTSDFLIIRNEIPSSFPNCNTVKLDKEEFQTVQGLFRTF